MPSNSYRAGLRKWAPSAPMARPCSPTKFAALSSGYRIERRGSSYEDLPPRDFIGCVTFDATLYGTVEAAVKMSRAGR